VESGSKVLINGGKLADYENDTQDCIVARGYIIGRDTGYAHESSNPFFYNPV
jgi:hypothetical protein